MSLRRSSYAVLRRFKLCILQIWFIFHCLHFYELFYLGEVNIIINNQNQLNPSHTLIKKTIDKVSLLFILKGHYIKSYYSHDWVSRLEVPIAKNSRQEKILTNTFITKV